MGGRGAVQPECQLGGARGPAWQRGASIGKYPGRHPGPTLRDRAMSMVRMNNKGPAKDLGGLQAGDVSFTQQKKVRSLCSGFEVYAF